MEISQSAWWKEISEADSLKYLYGSAGDQRYRNVFIKLSTFQDKAKLFKIRADLGLKRRKKNIWSKLCKKKAKALVVLIQLFGRFVYFVIKKNSPAELFLVV